MLIGIKSGGIIYCKSPGYFWHKAEILNFIHIYSVNRNGNHLTDDEIAGMCIGLLLAGQHTSSTTSAWLGFFLAQNKQLQVRIYNLWRSHSAHEMANHVHLSTSERDPKWHAYDQKRYPKVSFFLENRHIFFFLF